jgi:hypothetical protein
MVDGAGVEARLEVRDTCAPCCGDETAKDWPTSVLSWRLGTKNPVDTAGAHPESVPLASASLVNQIPPRPPFYHHGREGDWYIT